MKTFTKFFTLVVAFTMLCSISINAQPWTTADVNGDAGHPLLEIWVYGVTLPGAEAAAAGDQIGAFCGGTLVGFLTLTDVPSLANWSNFQLIAYSKNTSGETLYTPENPILLKYYNVSSPATKYHAFGWGDTKPIDFYNDWYAPTSEAITGTTEGAYFPPEGRSSYCYVDLTFRDVPIPEYGKVTVTVKDADENDLTNATVTTGEYNGTTNASGECTLNLFAGESGDDEDYNYTITVSLATYTTETFDITVNETGGGAYTQTVYLDGFGNLDGKVQAYDNDPEVGSPGFFYVENAWVSVTIDGITYSDYTDADGYYYIDSIPDGERDFAYSYNDCVTQNIARDIPHDKTTTINASDVKLTLKTGTITGEVYDAVTMTLINADFNLYELDDPLTSVASTTAVNGVYSLSHYGGTYNLVISLANYEDFTYENYVINPDNTVEKNFTLLPNTHLTPNYTAITGNPNKMWSIQVEMAKFGLNYMLPFDELVIFDRTQSGSAIPGEPGLRVGTLRLKDVAEWQNSGTNVLKAWGQFSNGDLGFVAGDEMEIWAYDISNDEEYGYPITWSFNPNAGTHHDTLFPDPAGNHTSFLNITWGTVPGELTGTVTDVAGGASPEIEDVTVEALNIFTQGVIDDDLTDVNGVYSISLDEGTYDIRFKKDGWKTVIKEDVEITQDITTVLNTTLIEQVEATINYVFAAEGYYFLGRCVTVANNDMSTLLNDGGTGFDDLTDSYVLHDDNVAVPGAYAANPMVWGGAAWTTPYPWELKEGYLLYIEANYSFDFVEYVVEPEDNPIEFASAGIYWIPYFPYDWEHPDDAYTAFESMFDTLDWVMESKGDKLHKSNGSWVDNIGTLSPSEGYKIKVKHACTLTYPATAKKSYTETTTMDPVHFVYNSGNAGNWTYTIFINTEEFDIGDEIAALSNGNIVGSMVISSDNPWDNDLNTFRIAVNGGYDINSAIELIAWDQSENKEYNTSFSMVNVNNKCYFGVNYPAGLDHFSFANVFRGTVTIDENQIDNTVNIYPNPASNMVNINARNNIKEVAVYNLLGNKVYSSTVDNKFININTSNLSQGVYIIQLNFGNSIINKKLSIQ